MRARCAAARGITTTTTCAASLATIGIPTTGTTTSVFVWCAPVFKLLLCNSVYPVLWSKFFLENEMAKKDMLIIKRGFEFAKWLLNHTAKFPKSSRFSVGVKLENAVLDFIELRMTIIGFSANHYLPRITPISLIYYMSLRGVVCRSNPVLIRPRLLRWKTLAMTSGKTQ